jgi:outer membrane protein
MKALFTLVWSHFFEEEVMRKQKLVVIIFLITLGLLWGKVNADVYVKVGYVDIPRILEGYKETQKATRMFGEGMRAKKEEIKEREKEIAELQRAFREQKIILSDREKRRREKEIDGKIKELEKFTKRVKEEFSVKERELAREIMREIYEVIKIVGIEGGYSLILEKRELLYGAEDLDLTEEILKRLNEGGTEKLETGEEG